MSALPPLAPRSVHLPNHSPINLNFSALSAAHFARHALLMPELHVSMYFVSMGKHTT